MSDTLGRITVPSPTASGLVFPLTTDFPAGMSRPIPIIEHRFGSNQTMGVQRFMVGFGPRKFPFIRQALSQTDRKTLLSFYNSLQGSFQTCLYDAPNQDGTVTRYEVIFDTQPLSVADLANMCRVGFNFIESPTGPTAPSYFISSTVTRYPSAALSTALTSQVQQIIPLVHIRVRNPLVPDIYVSDRRVTVGGQLYLPRLLNIGEPGSDVIMSQDISGAADNVRFTFGNADRVMSALAKDTNLQYASIDLCLYHVNSQILLQLWKGIVILWQGDGTSQFSMSCTDGLYPTTQPYPRRTITRQCWKKFNTEPACPWQRVTGGTKGNPSSCDFFFNSPNGCLSHGMSAYFGGHPEFPQSVTIKDNGTGIIGGFFRQTVTSTSILSDSIFGNPLPEIWCNSGGNPQRAFWANCIVAAVRDESTFEDVLGIVGAGPIGAYSGMSVQTNSDGYKFIVAPLADGFPPQGFKVDGQLNIVGYQPTLGLRQILGTDPVNINQDFFSLGQGTPQRWDVPDPVYSNVLTGQANDILPFAAGTAICEVRYKKTAGSGINPTTTEAHNLVVPIDQGMSGFKWDQFGNRSTVSGLTNPFWVAINCYLRALALDLGASVDQLAQFVSSAIFVGDGTGAAEIADLSVPVIVGTGNETQFQFQGTLAEFKPFRDWLVEILNCCLGYFTFEFGKLRLGIRENASATASFTLGNMLYQSLVLTPIQAAFEYLKIDFANAALQFQQDMAEYNDKDHADYFGRQGAPLTSRMRSVGICSLSQGLRIAATRTREEIGGVLRPDLANPFVEWDNAFAAQWKTTIIALDTYVGQVVELTHPDVPTYPGPVGGFPLPANTWKYRITRWTLHKDYSVTINAKSVTDSMYDLTVGPKPADLVPSTVPAISYALPPGPMWAPWQVQAASNDALFPSEYTFDVSSIPQPLQADGSPNSLLTVTGALPVTAYAPSIGAPIIPTITQSPTGGAIPGGTTWRLCLCALDTLGRPGPPSAVMIVQVPTGTNTNQITLSNISWPPVNNLSEWQLFASNQDDLICEQASGLLVGPDANNNYTPTTIILPGPFARSTYSVPDSSTALVRIKGKKYIHSGIIGAKVSSVSTNHIISTDLIDSSGSPINLAGRVLSVLGRPRASVPFASFNITSWNHATGDFTCSPDPSAIVQAGDAISVRYLGYDNTSDQLHFTDSGIQNQTNGYAGMIANAEVGHIIRVIAGKGRGQLRKITSNTSTQFGWDTPLLLDATSILIVEDNSWLFKADADSTGNADLSHTAQILIQAANFLDQALLLAGFTVDINSNECPDGDVPIREVWSYGEQGTSRIAADTTQLVTDGIVQFDTSSPTHAATTDTLNGAVGSGATSLTFTSGAGVVNGTYITIDTETYYVQSGSGATRTVVPGQLGTTTAAHSNGATVHIPGWIVYTLLPMSSIPNLKLYLHKNTSDINYVIVKADPGGSGDLLPNGSTTMILADTTPALGTLTLVAPAL